MNEQDAKRASEIRERLPEIKFSAKHSDTLQEAITCAAYADDVEFLLSQLSASRAETATAEAALVEFKAKVRFYLKSRRDSNHKNERDCRISNPAIATMYRHYRQEDGNIAAAISLDITTTEEQKDGK